MTAHTEKPDWKPDFRVCCCFCVFRVFVLIPATL